MGEVCSCRNHCQRNDYTTEIPSNVQPAAYPVSGSMSRGRSRSRDDCEPGIDASLHRVECGATDHSHKDQDCKESLRLESSVLHNNMEPSYADIGLAGILGSIYPKDKKEEPALLSPNEEITPKKDVICSSLMTSTRAPHVDEDESDGEPIPPSMLQSMPAPVDERKLA